MNTPGPEHLIFIPGVLLVGIVIGYIMGARAARAELEKRRRRAKE
jgi:proteasome assembly chaperone (PAC2) family protein